MKYLLILAILLSTYVCSAKELMYKNHYEKEDNSLMYTEWDIVEDEVDEEEIYEALVLANKHLDLSLVYGVYAVTTEYTPPEQPSHRHRRLADEIDQKDKDVKRIREIIKKYKYLGDK